MSLGEMLLEIQLLRRLDKLRLTQELEQEARGLIEPNRSFPFWSPDRAFTAAAALLQALEEDQGQQ